MRGLTWIVVFVAPLLTGCLGWGDASQWAGVPASVTSWDWVLDTGSLPSAPPAVDLLGLDAFDTDARYVDEATRNGTSVWCYLSIGTAEDWRDDYAALVAVDLAEREAGNSPILGEVLADWPGERLLDVSRYDVFLEVMIDRLRTCADKGFSLVEFDNMDTYLVASAFGFTQQDARAYVAALAGEARDRGLGVVHKNALELVGDLEPTMDVLLLESCVLHDECEAGEPFLREGKPVLDVEYPSLWQDAGGLNVDDVCEVAEAAGANTIFKTLEVDNRSVVCAAR